MVLGKIENQVDAFGVIEIIEPDPIMSCRRTTFTYTRQPFGLCLAIDKKYFRQAMENENISAIIAPPSAIIPKDRYGKTVVIAKRAADLFYFLHNQGAKELFVSSGAEFREKIDKSAHIDSTAVLSKKVCIGKNVTISAGCVLRDYSIVGDNTVLHPGVIIGADGVFAKFILDEKSYIRHFGGVRIGKNCVVHASSVVVRSVNYSEYTILSDGVHVGVRSSIGHDCLIGEKCDISSGVTISGRVKVLERSWIGAGAIIANALTIGKGATIRIGAVVVEDVKAHGDVSGNFAIRHSENIKNYIKNKTAYEE